jgi:hypothetical protein
LGVDQLQILREQEVILQFTRRPHGNGTKTGELSAPIASASLCQVRWYTPAAADR